ncbi:hypothetical protein GCM10009753_74130 [Streptantibioticus ferralitis]
MATVVVVLSSLRRVVDQGTDLRHHFLGAQGRDPVQEAVCLCRSVSIVRYGVFGSLYHVRRASTDGSADKPSGNSAGGQHWSE